MENYYEILTYGLNNKKIESNNSKDLCFIKEPNKCYIELLLKDYTDILSCENRANWKSKLAQYKRNPVLNSNIIGYPDTTSFTLRESAIESFHYRVLWRLINANSNENKPPEEILIMKEKEKFQLIKYENAIIIIFRWFK